MLYRYYAVAGLFVSILSAWTAPVQIFGENTTWKYFKGLSEASEPTTAWRAINYNDAAWLVGNAPFYYENSTPPYTGNTGLTDMFGNYTCIFMRKVFTIANPNAIGSFNITLRVDDGAIIWINGTRVAQLGMADGEPLFNDVALDANGEPKEQVFSIPTPSTFIAPGDNVVAIQAFNSSIGGSSDFLVSAAMSYDIDDTPPTLLSLVPPADSIVQNLTFLNVTFDTNVEGVDGADLLINDTATASVTAVSAREYQFNFPQPPSGTVTIKFATSHGIHDFAGNAFAGQMWFYHLDPNASGGHAIINEFLADNQHGLRDDFNEREDWIELLNLGPLQVDLAGYFLTDDAANLTKWRLPSVRLFANEYLLVFASGRDRTNALGQLHTNFKLNKDAGGYLALLDPSSNIVSVFANYPQQREDTSYGRDRVSPALTGFFPTPTPRGPNSTSGPGFAPEPVFSLEGGVFTNETLTLTLSASSGTIYYTLDGTNPTEASPSYSGPISLTNSRQVRARTFQSGLLPSAVAIQAYNLIGMNLNNFSSKLPIFVFNTGGANIPQNVPLGQAGLLSSLVVIDTFRGRATLTGKPQFVGLSGMEVRGQVSAGFPKMPYRLELSDSSGNDLDFPLLGMPADADWILRNPYSEKPFINDFLTLEMYEQMGNYSLRRRLVEVFVDTNGGKLDYPGDYRGIYTLQEAIKINNKRVNLAKLSPNDNAEPNISGGYIWKKDKDTAGDLNFSTSGANGFGGQAFKYHDPKPREITVAQQNWLRTYLNTMEIKLYANNWLTATGANHWSYYIDQASFVDQHWIVEFTKQIDGYRLSNFMNKDRGGKVKMNPIFDWDLGWGNADYLDGGHSSGWYYELLSFGDHFWLRRLITGSPASSGVGGDPDFVQAIIDRWGVLRTNIMNGERVVARIEELYTLLQESAARDFAKWPRLGVYIWPNPNGGSWDVNYVAPTTYRGIIDQMIKWTRGRYAWIDARNGTPGSVLPAPPTPSLSHPGGQTQPGTVVNINAASGTVYYTMNGADPRLPGGGIRPGAQIYNGPITITANARIVARAVDNNLWSAPAAATYVIAIPPLIITELMYHPSPPPGGNPNEVDNYQYIELKNIGSATLSLAGYQFVDGVQFNFSAGSEPSLAQGQKVLVVRNAAAFAARYPGIGRVAGEFQGALAHGGERITLLGPNLETVHDFEYQDDWYPATDGLGFALAVANEAQPRENWNMKIGWRAGALGGTPGQDEAAAPNIPGIVINEALTRPETPNADAIELFNPTAQAVNISGWYLSDDHGQPKYHLPNNTIIAGNGYLQFTEAQFNVGNDAFSLSPAGGEVYLFSADGAGNLTGYVQGYQFGAALRGVSFGRYANSQGTVFFVAQQNNTLFQANSGPRVGPIVISEIMYAPPEVFVNGAFWDNTELEFIEFHNLSGQQVSLNGTTGTWRLEGGVEFAFPANTTLATGERVLVVSFDPTSDTTATSNFRIAYGLDATPRLFGPFKSNLSNSGASLRLVQPDVVRLDDGNDLVVSVLMDEVEYSAALPWPVAADRIGPSLQKTLATAFGNDPANWVAAAPSPGDQYEPGPAPRITQQPTNTTGIVGGTVAFHVAVSGPGVSSYQWRFNGVNLVNANEPDLILQNVQPDQAGQYQVVALNAANSVASDIATLTVLFAASITEQPQGAKVPPGADVMLEVKAQSTTPITYQWFKNNFAISGAVAPTLNLQDVQPNDAGSYRVRVRDAVGDVFSSAAQVVVLVDPIITVQPVGITNMVGSTVTFSVAVTNTASLPLGYRWRRGGVTIANRILNTRTDFLVLENIQTTDTGNYNVVITNAASYQPGSVSQQARLGVVTAGLDNDHDGIPNDWETAHNLDPNNPADAAQDADGDGYTNGDEYTAGTDPQNPSSFLQVDQITANGGANITFRAEASRTYSVQYRNALSVGIWINLEGVPSLPNARVVTIHDPGPVIGQRYYRLVAPGVPGQ